MDKIKFRRKVKEEWEREWIKKALLLRDKSPEETVEAMFDLSEFVQELQQAGKRAR